MNLIKDKLTEFLKSVLSIALIVLGLKLYLVGRGIAFTVPLSGISSIINGAILSGADKTVPVDDLVDVGRFEDYVDGEENR